MIKRKTNKAKSAVVTTAVKIIKVTKYPQVRSKEIYSAYNKQERLCSQLSSDITLLKDTIKSKSLTEPGVKGQPERQIKLSSVQLAAYKRELREKEYALKLEVKKRKAMEPRYTKVNKINKSAASYGIQKINRQIKLSRLANKSKEELLSVVTKLVQSLESKVDKRINILRKSAISNGLIFYNTMNQIIRSELKGKETLDLLKASNQVKSEIIKNIRESFGYKPKQ